MNKAVKDAIARGKVARFERDQKLEQEAKAREEQKKAKEAEEKAKLDEEVDRYLSYVPMYLAQAIEERKPTFSIVTYESDKSSRFSSVCALLEPKIKKMGLQTKHTSTTGWVQLTYDPDTGYDATYYHLDIIVPEDV